jgi:hypothetical protein
MIFTAVLKRQTLLQSATSTEKHPFRRLAGDAILGTGPRALRAKLFGHQSQVGPKVGPPLSLEIIIPYFQLVISF